MQDNGIVQTTNTDKVVVCEDCILERSDFEEVSNESDDTSADTFSKVYQCHEVRYTLSEYMIKMLNLK